MFQKPPVKYVFDKRYEHHLSFRVEDEDGKTMWRESFQNVADAQANIPSYMKIDWEELIDQVDYNQTKTEDEKRKLEKAMGFNIDEADI